MSPIPVVHDGAPRGEPRENCCFCYRHTNYWHLRKDVAVCEECAAKHDVNDIPSKSDWCEAVDKKFPNLTGNRRALTMSDIHREQLDRTRMDGREG